MHIQQCFTYKIPEDINIKLRKASSYEQKNQKFFVSIYVLYAYNQNFYLF